MTPIDEVRARRRALGLAPTPNPLGPAATVPELADPFAEVRARRAALKQAEIPTQNNQETLAAVNAEVAKLPPRHPHAEVAEVLKGAFYGTAAGGLEALAGITKSLGLQPRDEMSPAEHTAEELVASRRPPPEANELTRRHYEAGSGVGKMVGHFATLPISFPLAAGRSVVDLAAGLNPFSGVGPEKAVKQFGEEALALVPGASSALQQSRVAAELPPEERGRSWEDWLATKAPAEIGAGAGIFGGFGKGVAEVRARRTQLASGPKDLPGPPSGGETVRTVNEAVAGLKERRTTVRDPLEHEGNTAFVLERPEGRLGVGDRIEATYNEGRGGKTVKAFENDADFNANLEQASLHARQLQGTQPVSAKEGGLGGYPTVKASFTGREFTPDNLKRAFNLTDPQAAASIALADAMGLDKSLLEVTRGGEAAEGALKQEGRELSKLGFYSNAEEALSSWQFKGTPGQLMAHLGKTAGALEESKWIGLEEFLAGKKIVSKAEVEKFLEENRVEVKEQVRGGSPTEVRRKELTESLEKVSEEYGFALNKVSPYVMKIHEDKGTIAKYHLQVRVADRISDYARDQILGFESKRLSPQQKEIFESTVPEKLRSKLVEAFKRESDLQRELENLRPRLETAFSQYQIPGGENYRELLLTLPGKKPGKVGPPVSEIEGHRQVLAADARRFNDFTSPHFKEPNILAHVRLNDRIAPDGKRVLFLEEVQSDWAQKGREAGFGPKYPPELEAKIRALGLDPANASIQTIEKAGGSPELANEWFQKVVKRKGGSVPPAPFVTKTESWTGLALKRMFRYAVENGYDRIAWTTGEQQAERYDLSKHIGELVATKLDNDRYQIRAYAPDRARGESPLVDSVYVTNQLPEVVGKELAQKIVTGQGRSWEDSQTYSGLDLKVGGEGMKAFYDKILPATAEKIVRKYGGKVEWKEVQGDLKLGPEPESGIAMVPADTFKTKNPTIEITPSLREEIQRGLPLFQGKKGSVEFATDGRALLRGFEAADVSTAAHEIGHVARRHLLNREVPKETRFGISDQDISVAEAWAGVKEGKWHTEAEEKFARAFEQYLRDGRSPITALNKIFEAFRKWLNVVYNKLVGSDIDIKVSKEMQVVFDRLVLRGVRLAERESLQALSRKKKGLFEISEEERLKRVEALSPEEKDRMSEMPRREHRDYHFVLRPEVKAESLKRFSPELRKQVEDLGFDPLTVSHKDFGRNEELANKVGQEKNRVYFSVFDALKKANEKRPSALPLLEIQRRRIQRFDPELKQKLIDHGLDPLEASYEDIKAAGGSETFWEKVQDERYRTHNTIVDDIDKLEGIKLFSLGPQVEEFVELSKKPSPDARFKKIPTAQEVLDALDEGLDITELAPLELQKFLTSKFNFEKEVSGTAITNAVNVFRKRNPSGKNLTWEKPFEKDFPNESPETPKPKPPPKKPPLKAMSGVNPFELVKQWREEARQRSLNEKDTEAYTFLRRTASRIASDPDRKAVEGWTLEGAEHALKGLEAERGSASLTPDQVTWLEKAREVYTRSREFQKEAEKSVKLPLSSEARRPAYLFRRAATTQFAALGEAENTVRKANGLKSLRRGVARLDKVFDAVVPGAGAMAMGDLAEWKRQVADKITKAEPGTAGFDEIKKAVEGPMQKLFDDNLQLQVETGNLSPAGYAEIKSGNDFYAPFRVLTRITEGAPPGGGGQGRNIAGAREATKAIVGIHHEFSLEQVLKAGPDALVRGRMIAEKNRAMLEIGKLADQDKQGLAFRRFAEGDHVRKGYEVVSFNEKGERVQVEVHKDVARALTGLSAGEVETVGKVLLAGQNVFRIGATTWNLGWQAVNFLFADALTAMLVSRYGLGGPNLTNALDLFRAPVDFGMSLWSSARGNAGLANAEYISWLKSGALQSTAQREFTPKVWRRMMGLDKGLKITIPGDAMAKLTSTLEETWKGFTLRRGWRFEANRLARAATPEDAARIYADIVAETRRFGGSPDFLRSGEWLRSQGLLKVLFTFVNARTQGVASGIGRTVGATGAHDAAMVHGRLAIAVGLPTAYVWWMNNRDDKRKADLATVDDRERHGNWMIPLDRTFTNAEGQAVPDYVKIPKRETMQFYSSLVESVLDYAASKDREALMKQLQKTFGDLSPVDLKSYGVASLNPVVRVPIEQAMGKTAYTGQDIVPRRLQKEPPEEQYTFQTPSIYKEIGRLTGTSPLRWEAGAQGMLGALPTQFIPRAPAIGRSSFTESPIGRRFTRSTRVNLEPIYTEFRKGEQVKSHIDRMSREGQDPTAYAAANGENLLAYYVLKPYLDAISGYRSEVKLGQIRGEEAPDPTDSPQFSQMMAEALKTLREARAELRGQAP